MTVAAVKVVNLKLFLRDLRAAEDASPRELSKAIRAAGRSPLERVRQLAPSRSGRLRSGYSVRAAGAIGRFVNLQPYGAGAEWGVHGKWSGFMRYGPRGRFAWRAVQERAEEIAQDITEGLKEIIEILGWARR